MIKLNSVDGMEDFFLHRIDNFLSPTYFAILKERLVRVDKYAFMPHTSYVEDSISTQKNVFDVGQFVYSVLTTERGMIDAAMFNFIEPALFQLYDHFPEITFHGVVRMKANMLMKRVDAPAHTYNEPHIDLNATTAYSALLYLDDSDGDTVIFRERNSLNDRPQEFTEFMRVKPQANTMLLFNSSYYHASCNPKQSNTRLVLNIVFNAGHK